MTAPSAFAIWAWDFPELGCVSLSELAALRGPLGLAVERDRHFIPARTIGAYADEARAASRILA